MWELGGFKYAFEFGLASFFFLKKYIECKIYKDKDSGLSFVNIKVGCDIYDF